MLGFMDSLRFRLLLLVLMSALPAFGLTVYSGLEQRRLASSGAKDEALRLVRLAASAQAAQIEGAYQLLVALAHLSEVREGDPETCSAFLSDLAQYYPNYTALSAIDLNGNVFCNSIRTTSPVNVSDRSYFQQVLQTRDFVMGNYSIGRISGKAILPFAYPISNESGKVQGVVLAALDLDWLNQIILRTNLPEQAALVVVDEQGIILGRYPEGEKWVGKEFDETPIIQAILSQHGEGTAETVGLDNIERLYAFTRLQSPENEGIYVSIGIPTRLAYAEANQSLARNLAALALVTGLALAAAWFGSDVFVLRKVNALVNAAHRLAAGDLGVRTGLKDNHGELGQLASAFDQMAINLEERQTLLRNAEARYRSLVEKIPAVTYISKLDPENNTIYISPQIETMLGFSPQEWIADHQIWSKLIHPEDQNRVLEEIAHTRAMGEPFHSEYRIFTRDDRLLWIRDEASLVQDNEGNALFLQGLMIEITERKQAEAALKNYAVRLERSNQELQDFAYVASHDLQEPLRKIQAFGERLQVKFSSVLDAEGQDYLERMRNSAARMQALINDLLSYSRVTSKAQPFEPVNLNDIAAQVVSDLGELISNTTGKVELGELPVIHADPQQMFRLLQNLIGNGLKFHKPGVPPVVKVSSRTVSSDFVQIFVEDNGIGFEEKYLGRIFLPFQRLHGRYEYEGSGIGLAISRKIVERHNGRITAKSTPGKGATFMVELPTRQFDQHTGDVL